MSSTTEQIKDRLSIVDVVESYLKLEKAGSNLKAKCPFHNEKTPSFFISPARGSFYCFGCNRGGDIFTFIEEIEGLDFSGSLKILADRAGVVLDQGDFKIQKEQNKLGDILEEATSFFEENLKKNDEALNYLKKRGLKTETIKKFRLGYTNNQWNELFDFLKNKEFNNVDIEKAGLVVEGGRSGFYDRFRGRIIFPINNHSGKVVGFSGRLFPEDNSDKAKYINSPETALYHKSKILYGYDMAKMAMRSNNFCVLVEGQMDLLMSHQEGFPNTVAVSGTSLTEDHLLAIKRLTDNLIIAFDSDQAGLSASEKGFNLALSLEMNVKIINLPRNTDPADFLLTNSQEWQEKINKSQHLVDFFLGVLENAGYDDREFGLEVGKKVLPYVLNIKNKIDQAHFVSIIAHKLKKEEKVIWEELERLHSLDKNNFTKTENSLNNQKFLNRSITRRKIIEGKILGLLLWQDKIKKPEINNKKAYDKYKQIVGGERLEELNNLNQKTKDALIFKSEVSYENHNNLNIELKELFFNLEEVILRDEIEKITKKLKIADQKGDKIETTKIQKEIQELHQKINNLIKNN